MDEQYRIENFSNPCPFTVLVSKEGRGDLSTYYEVRINILGKWFTRTVNTRLEGIILAKDIARSLEDAFRNAYEDKS